MEDEKQAVKAHTRKGYAVKSYKRNRRRRVYEAFIRRREKIRLQVTTTRSDLATIGSFPASSQLNVLDNA